MGIDFAFRIIVLVVFVLTFSISGYYRRKARETGDTIERREEGSFVLVLRMIFGLLLLVTLLLNIFYPRALSWSKVELPMFVRITGVIIACNSIPLIVWVFRNIGKNISETVLTKKNHELVTSGPYRWVRHPLYSSALLLLFSISLILGDWLVFIYSLGGMIAFRYLVIPAEEEKLIAAFGKEYKEYQNRTGALLPKF